MHKIPKVEDELSSTGWKATTLTTTPRTSPGWESDSMAGILKPVNVLLLLKFWEDKIMHDCKAHSVYKSRHPLKKLADCLPGVCDVRRWNTMIQRDSILTPTGHRHWPVQGVEPTRNIFASMRSLTNSIFSWHVAPIPLYCQLQRLSRGEPC